MSSFPGKGPTEEEFEASQVDHFSSEERIEQLKKLLGEKVVKTRREHFANFDKTGKECTALMFAGKENPIFANFSTFLLACTLRKNQLYGKPSFLSRLRTNCFKDQELDEIMNVDDLLKQPTDVIQRKCDEMDMKMFGCMKNPISDVFGMIMDFNDFDKPYSEILANPTNIEILKSRYLPNKTIIEKKAIQSELMEPYIFNPKTDSEQDFNRKLMALSNSQFLKHDLEHVKHCYQSKGSNKYRDCVANFLDIMNLSDLILCKREILASSSQVRFPFIEDAADKDFARNGTCSKLLANNLEKLFPNMPDFTKKVI